jgi:hypothetical protein
VRRALLLLMLAVLLLPACGNTDRPEGVVERWLISLNQGKAGEPEKYAPDALSQRILPNWQKRDPGDLEVIEVGKGGASRTGPTYLVPFRIQRLDGNELDAIAEVVSPLHGPPPWHIERLLAPDVALRVPSQGGTPVGSSTPTIWLAAIGVAVSFVLISIALMSTVGRPTRVSA